MDDIITRAESMARGLHILAKEATELAEKARAHKAATEKPEKVSDITGFPEDDLQE